MAITRWKPFDEIVRSMEHEIEDFFEDFFKGRRWPIRVSGEALSWFPRVDISENEDAVVVTAEVPGMEKEDIKITLMGNTLTISGDKKIIRDEKKENYYRAERLCGSFSRSFIIPSSINPDEISASYKDGILKINLPKQEKAKHREIKIKAE